MSTFKKETGDWTKFRELKPNIEVDFHWGRQRDKSFWEIEGEMWDVAFEALKKAYEKGIPWVLFTHGWSTSRRGKTTARSIVRQLMRDKVATPYIIRKDCIQHDSVFVACIRAKK